MAPYTPIGIFNPPSLQYHGMHSFMIGYGFGTPNPQTGSFDLFDMEVLAPSWAAAGDCIERYLKGPAND